MGQSYRELIAWQKAMDMVSEVYRLTGSFPREETYGLTIQLRRAAVSVPSNIAEGQARYSPREFRHFLSHVRGSLVEIETQILIAERLGYTQATETKTLTKTLMESLAELGRILNGLIGSIKIPSENREPRTEN